jgi:hypothetical protein
MAAVISGSHKERIKTAGWSCRKQNIGENYYEHKEDIAGNRKFGGGHFTGRECFSNSKVTGRIGIGPAPGIPSDRRGNGGQGFAGAGQFQIQRHHKVVGGLRPFAVEQETLMSRRLDFVVNMGRMNHAALLPILFFKKVLSHGKFAQDIAIIALVTSGLKS